jgi:hypothetical protein
MGGEATQVDLERGVPGGHGDVVPGGPERRGQRDEGGEVPGERGGDDEDAHGAG